jgi:hypothetical protein
VPVRAASVAARCGWSISIARVTSSPLARHGGWQDARAERLLGVPVALGLGNRSGGDLRSGRGLVACEWYLGARVRAACWARGEVMAGQAGAL